jgi:hypothetical protein
VHFEKARGFHGQAAQPFEARYEVRDGLAVWTRTEMVDAERARVVAALKDGMSIRQAAEALGMHKSMIASHACITAIDVAADRAFLLNDLGDASALGWAQRDSVFIVDGAATIAEILDGPLSCEAIAVVFVILVALDPQLLTGLGIRWGGGQACGNYDHCCNHRQPKHVDPPLDYRATPRRQVERSQ